MDTKDISNLLLKIGGMFIIVMSISHIQGYVSAYTQYAERSFPLFLSIVVIPNIIPLLLGIFIFTKPSKITNKIIHEGAQEEGRSANSAVQGIEQIALTVLGFYLLSLAFSDIVYHLTNFIKAKSNLINQGGTLSNSQILTAPFIATIAELWFSLWLIFKSKGIVLFIKQIRTAGNKTK